MWDVFNYTKSVLTYLWFRIEKRREIVTSKVIAILERRQKWNGRMTLTSHLPTATPEMQLFTEQLSMRMAWRLAEKIFHNKRYEEGPTMRCVGGAETQSSQDPYPWSTTHKEEDNPLCDKIIEEVLTKEWWIQDPHQDHSPGIVHQKDKPPEHLVWRPVGLAWGRDEGL